MNRHHIMARLRLFAFVSLVSLVLGQEGCVWDLNTEVNQGLDPLSLVAGATYIAHLPELSDDETCQQACCDNEACQLALTETNSNGTLGCFLVNCMKEDQDVCILMQSDTVKVYRKAPESTPDIFAVRSANSTDRCRYVNAVGPCRAAFIRFFYNVSSQTCEKFIYGGCGGNNNIFNSPEDCLAVCAGVTGDMINDPDTLPKKPRMVQQEDNEEVSSEVPLPEVTVEEFAEKCEAAPQTGLCRASVPRYYYDSGACKRFTYGGCGGNRNNYETEQECMTACTVKIMEKNVDDDKEYQEACGAPSDSGPCRAAFPKFYFDSDSQSCHMFIYGGCKGNMNRYNTMEECMSKCAGEHGMPAWAKPCHHWSPAIFLMTTLTIICVMLLVGLIVIAKRRVKRQQLLVLDDQRELLPEEQLSVEDPPKAALY
ncbi:hypothetical protein P4O66_017693 [Electrophorus voltai]|uniref:Serine peptidase inhibitor, Kunitz type, 2 n=1 Tax=Electrophorus voltai TaxID=2609070 RepID=A0AAD8YU03_9TELE|nr:hypothetical protein P4O66_017693 [Electrophorus voltai]